jgi:class 3 adenylate cyclase
VVTVVATGAPLIASCATIRWVEMPEVRFVRTADELAIAYQVWGSGEPNILSLYFVPHSLDWRWSHPSARQLLEYMGDLGTNALLDLRGNGSSDLVPNQDLGDVTAWVADVLSVMDVCGMDAAVMFCSGPACHVAMKLAVEASDRVVALWLADPVLRVDPKLVDFMVRYIEQHWGTGRVSESSGTVDLALDDHGRRERLSAARSTAAAMVRRSYSFDASMLATQIAVPTMVAYTGTLAWVTHDDTKLVHSAIPGSDYVDVSAGTHLYRPVSTEALEAFERFIVGRALNRAEHTIASVVFTDMVGSTDRAVAAGDMGWVHQLRQLTQEFARCISSHDAELLKDTGDGLVILSQSAIDAARLAPALVHVARGMGVEIRVGVHTGPVIRRDGDIAGISVNTAARVMSCAGPSQIWVSRTVVDLLAGSGARFEDRGLHTLKGLPGEWQLFQLTKPPP